MASRHRSDTSLSTHTADHRPDSRASTTSAASPPPPDHQLQQQHDDQKEPMHLHHNNGHPLPPSMNQPNPFMHGNPEAALLQYHATIDPQQYAAHLELAQHAQPQQQHMHPHHPAHSASFPVHNPYPVHEAAYMQPDMQYNQHVRLASVPLQSGNEGHDDKRRKGGSAVTATNDKELREMLARNESRPLKDVAQEVIQKERTPMAEKTKQLFAMLWLRAVCKSAKTSVPRNRVYSQYASRCGTERVVPLNPASFGKLVRVIFPGIQTRRLGVRGESKYHYVDLALDEDPPASGLQYTNGLPDSRPRSQSTSAQQIDFNNIPRLQADTAAFPSEPSFDFSPSLRQPEAPRGPASKGQAFAYPEVPGMQHGTAESATYTHILRFPSSNLAAFTENEPVNLPPIHPYLPPKTDRDTADALVALYRTHCTSLIDSIRFCKEKQFFRLYTSFHGTLTVPVQKLFTHPNLAPWITRCDTTMYRTMVRFVSRLTLQAAPPAVLNILSHISATLHSHIAKTFSGHPPHVQHAKLRPATVFAALLHRLVRVNQAAHAAANLLSIDANRDSMWREWSTAVNPKRVLEASVPPEAFEIVYPLLTTEMRRLLEPLPDHPYHPNFSNDASGISTENVLDRWSAFLSSLPSLFPHASARKVLLCLSAVGTAALRDLTIMGGASYGHWWVLKIFVDEMVLWGAEMGGFLEGEGDEASVESAVGEKVGVIGATAMTGMMGEKEAVGEDVDDSGIGMMGDEQGQQQVW